MTGPRFDDGTTANGPACGAYDAVNVVFNGTFVVTDDEFVVIDWRVAVLTTTEPPPELLCIDDVTGM